MLLAALLQFVVAPLRACDLRSTAATPGGDTACCCAGKIEQWHAGASCCEQEAGQPGSRQPDCHCDEVPDLDPLLPGQSTPRQQQDEDEDPQHVHAPPPPPTSVALESRCSQAVFERGPPWCADTPPLYLLQRVFRL